MTRATMTRAAIIADIRAAIGIARDTETYNISIANDEVLKIIGDKCEEYGYNKVGHIIAIMGLTIATGKPTHGNALKKKGRPRYSKWSDMKVGDVRNLGTYERYEIQKQRSSANVWGKNQDPTRKFKAHKNDDDTMSIERLS